MNQKRRWIVIDSPTELGSFKQIIAGRASHRNMDIRVMILSQDGLWYSQPDAVWHGHKWAVTATLGYEFRVPGTPYGIVAVEGKPEPEPVASIPLGVTTSQIIVIERRKQAFN